ncbi:hypothetical protein QZH41_008850, partial [Actinostola sp. cb2023]
MKKQYPPLASGLVMATQLAPDIDKAKAYSNAIKDIIESGLSVRKAAKEWGVARSSLHDRLRGNVVHEKPGRCQVLCPTEECRFTDWLTERFDRGFGVSKREFLESVKLFLDKGQRKTRLRNNLPGNKWYRGFVKRNPQMKLRSARPLSKKRAQLTAEDVDTWFQHYGTFIGKLGLSNSPSQIWSCEATIFEIQGRSECATLLHCFSAIGECIPPHMVFQGKRTTSQCIPLEGGVDGSVYSLTKSGHVDSITLYSWMTNHFIPYLPPELERPVVLLVNNIGPYFDLETSELAKKNNIYIFALLRKAAHLVSPAGVGVLGPLKHAWSKNITEYSQENPDTDIDKIIFGSLFKETWENVMRPSILIHAFGKSGVYPINRQQISHDQITLTSPDYASSSIQLYATTSAARLPSAITSHSASSLKFLSASEVIDVSAVEESSIMAQHKESP